MYFIEVYNDNYNITSKINKNMEVFRKAIRQIITLIYPNPSI